MSVFPKALKESLLSGQKLLNHELKVCMELFPSLEKEKPEPVEKESVYQASDYSFRIHLEQQLNNPVKSFYIQQFFYLSYCIEQPAVFYT